MVLERLQSMFCISSVTKSFSAKRFTLPHPTDESKSLALVGEINFGCLIHPLFSRMLIELTSIELTCHQQLVNHAVTRTKRGCRMRP